MPINKIIPVGIFQSTPSVRRETALVPIEVSFPPTISIHSLRAEGDLSQTFFIASQASISIHSLRAEGDTEFTHEASRYHVISIHSLRAEGDEV